MTPTRDSRENRLSFFYADRQKGATSYDETERETREELTAEIEDSKKKIQQYENREKILRQKLSHEERRRETTALSSGAQSLKALCRKQRT